MLDMLPKLACGEQSVFPLLSAVAMLGFVTLAADLSLPNTHTKLMMKAAWREGQDNTGGDTDKSSILPVLFYFSCFIELENE